MKIIYQSYDGISFNTEQECLAYEKANELFEHIKNNIGSTYCSDSGFSIIEESNVEDYIRANIDKINEILGILS